MHLLFVNPIGYFNWISKVLILIGINKIQKQIMFIHFHTCMHIITPQTTTFYKLPIYFIQSQKLHHK